MEARQYCSVTRRGCSHHHRLSPRTSQHRQKDWASQGQPKGKATHSRNCQSLPQAELFVRQRERPGLPSQAVARHGCTCVPHPEPLSHLPPHPTPLGHPSAPALSTLSHASNLDWQSVSHMIIYMFQCYFLSIFLMSGKFFHFDSVKIKLTHCNQSLYREN